MKMNSWFEVDKQGFAKILEYKGRNRALLIVEDDAPEGFMDLSHAFTLFAESAKKSNPERRGRFNFGEKLVLAISDQVTILSTRGGIRFDAQGRHRLRTHTSVGSRVECLVRISREECAAIEGQVLRLIPPQRICTTFNGRQLEPRVPLARFPATLPTEIANEDGLLRRVNRATTIRLYPVLAGETAALYEMGIPVAETGDRWHSNSHFGIARPQPRRVRCLVPPANPPN
jgi:hypothetical protein